MTTLTLRDTRKMRLRMLSSLLLRGRPPWKGSSSAAVLLYLARTAQRTRARLVGEIGFDAGFSSRAFLKAHPDIRVVSFDLGATRWVRIAKSSSTNAFPAATRLCGATHAPPAPSSRHPLRD